MVRKLQTMQIMEVFKYLGIHGYHWGNRITLNSFKRSNYQFQETMEHYRTMKVVLQLRFKSFQELSAIHCQIAEPLLELEALRTLQALMVVTNRG